MKPYISSQEAAYRMLFKRPSNPAEDIGGLAQEKLDRLLDEADRISVLRETRANRNSARERLLVASLPLPERIRKALRGDSWLKRTMKLEGVSKRSVSLCKFAGVTSPDQILCALKSSQCPGEILPGEDRALLYDLMRGSRIHRMDYWTIGADPELALVDRGREVCAPPEYRDGNGFTGEIRPEPARSIAGLIKNTRLELFNLACQLPNTRIEGAAGAYPYRRPLGGHIHLHHPGVMGMEVKDAIHKINRKWIGWGSFGGMDEIERRRGAGYGHSHAREPEWAGNLTCQCSGEYREPPSWLASPEIAAGYLAECMEACAPGAFPDARGLVPSSPIPPPRRGGIFRRWGIRFVGRHNGPEWNTIRLAENMNAVRKWRSYAGPRISIRFTNLFTVPQGSRKLLRTFPHLGWGERDTRDNAGSAVIYLPIQLKEDWEGCLNLLRQVKTIRRSASV